MKFLIECEDNIYGTFERFEDATAFASKRLQGREWTMRYMHVVPTVKDATVHTEIPVEG